MALITSSASGNFNSGATWTGGIVPTVGDEARASTGHTITITANATCDEISNAGTGVFVLSNGVTLTANVTHKGANNGTNCIAFTAASPATGTIIGNVTGGTAYYRVGAGNTSSGTLVIQGNCSGGSDAPAVNNASTGSVIITGNITGSTTSTAVNSSGVNNELGGSVAITGNATGGLCSAVNNAAGGSVAITGNVTGGTAGNSAGVRNASTGSCIITGISAGGSNATAAGIINVSTGAVTLNGRSVGGANVTAGPGVINSSTGTINIIRAAGNGFGPGSSGLSAAVGALNSGLGIIEIQQLEYGTFGQTPTSGTGIRLRKLGSNVAVFNYVDSGAAKTLVDATQANQPAVTDVRSGVSYASGALTGTCAVPATGSVALGVPVGSTTGTAVLTQSDVQSALTAQGLTSARAMNLDNLDATVSSRLAPSGTLATVTNLTNAPASVTPSDIWSHATRTLTSASGPTAVQIRQEIDANSTKLDAAISTRATPGNIPAADITAIKAKTDALNTTRLAQVATTELVGGLLAQANS